MIRILAAVALFIFASGANAQDLSTPSTWKNQRGSIMQLHFWNPFDKQLVGTYTNNAPGFPHCAGKPYFLWGNSDGRKMTFTVVWSGPFLEDCKSTTVWTGRVKGKKISTSWVLTRTNGEIYKGKDSFTRQ